MREYDIIMKPATVNQWCTVIVWCCYAGSTCRHLPAEWDLLLLKWFPLTFVVSIHVCFAITGVVFLPQCLSCLLGVLHLFVHLSMMVIFSIFFRCMTLGVSAKWYWVRLHIALIMDWTLHHPEGLDFASALLVRCWLSVHLHVDPHFLSTQHVYWWGMCWHCLFHCVWFIHHTIFQHSYSKSGIHSDQHHECDGGVTTVSQLVSLPHLMLLRPH